MPWAFVVAPSVFVIVSVAGRETTRLRISWMLLDPPVLPLYRPYESWAMRKDIAWAPKPGHIPYVLDFRAGAISFASN